MVLSVSGSPGNPIGPGVRAVSHDANGAATNDYDDIIVRSQVRFTLLGGEEDFVGLFVGGQTDSAESSYWAGIRQDGLLASGIVVDGAITDSIWMSTDLDVLDQDVVLEFGRTGSTLSFTAWPADGSQKPAMPQLTFDSNLYGGGTVGVFLDPNNTFASAAAFRYFETMPVVAGDFSTSNSLDVEDIQLIDQELRSPSTNRVFDLDDDGLVTGEDRRILIQDLFGASFGDSNLDGTVDAGDLNSLALNWQSPTTTNWAKGDFTGDGHTNAADLNVLALNWQSGQQAAISAASVPEPTSALLLAVGLMIGVSRLRYRPQRTETHSNTLCCLALWRSTWIRTRHVLLAFAAFVILGDMEIGAQAFKSDIDAWVAQDTIDPPPHNALLFVGDSGVRIWERLALDFAEYDVIQRGYGGAKFSDLNRYVDQIVLPYDPAAIVLIAGANDLLSGGSMDTVFRSYQTFVDLVHSGQDPNRDPIPIFNIGLTAAPGFWECCRTLASEWNSLIQQHAQSDASLYYVDTQTQLLATAAGPDLPPSEALYLFDRAHLNHDGYDILAETIKPLIESVVPSTKTYQPNVLHPAVGSRLLIDFGPNTSPSNLSLGTDENGNAWNNWLPEGRDGPPATVLAGRHMGDLISTSGDNTGVGIVITGEFVPSFGGLQSPDSRLLGDFAIESASVDYFASDNAFAPGGFMVTGLDINATYEFRFFASRQSTAGFTTEYLITGKNEHRIELQTSGRDIGHNGEYDGNDDDVASVSGIRPNEFGQVFVDLEPLNGNQALINALEISVASTGFTTGDFDHNGVLDVLDIDALTQAVLSGQHPVEFDINSDGNVDRMDRDVWVAELKMTYFGDSNLDGMVDAGDLNNLALNWQSPSTTSWALGDFTGDGNTNAADLNLLALNWRSGQQAANSAASVPEPASALLLAAGLILGVSHFCRSRSDVR